VRSVAVTLVYYGFNESVIGCLSPDGQWGHAEPKGALHIGQGVHSLSKSRHSTHLEAMLFHRF
jgi:hypothetical protein